MRLIDANEVIEKINCLCVDGNENWIGTDNQSFVDHSEVIDILADAPTVDAVLLPCKIGDDVYIVPSKVNFHLNVLNRHEENNRIYHQKVDSITFTKRGWYVLRDADHEYGTGRLLLDRFYKETWFLTREEAEAALAKMDGGKKDHDDEEGGK